MRPVSLPTILRSLTLTNLTRPYILQQPFAPLRNIIAHYNPAPVTTSVSTNTTFASSAGFSTFSNTIKTTASHSKNPLRLLTKRSSSIFPFLGFVSLFSSSISSSSSGSKMSNNYPVSKSDSEWQAVLSPAQFRVIREKGTEAPYTGEYDKHMPSSGVYNCAACDAPLYRANHKFKSGCGWPAYFDSLPGAVERHTDRTLGMDRTEITCARCGGHLGHVFKGEGYATPTDERHCVNSVSLKFDGDAEGDAKAKA